MTPLAAVRASASLVALLAVAGCGASTPLLGVTGQVEGDAGAGSGGTSSGGSSSGVHGTFGTSSAGHSTIGYSTATYSTIGYSTVGKSTATATSVRYSTGKSSATYSTFSYSSGTSVPPNPECSPHALVGFTATPDLPPSPTCTATEETELGVCFTNTSSTGTTACNEALLAPDGGPNACYDCVITPSGATAWGALIGVDAPTAIGATTTTELDMVNMGGCVAKEDPSAAGFACATALDELTECELAACLAYCAVASDTDQAGINALFGDGTAANPGCLADANTAVCFTYANVVNTACATESNDAGTGALDKCNTLVTEIESAAPTAAEATAYFTEPLRHRGVGQRSRFSVEGNCTPLAPRLAWQGGGNVHRSARDFFHAPPSLPGRGPGGRSSCARRARARASCDEACGSNASRRTGPRSAHRGLLAHQLLVVLVDERRPVEAHPDRTAKAQGPRQVHGGREPEVPGGDQDDQADAEEHDVRDLQHSNLRLERQKLRIHRYPPPVRLAEAPRRR